MTEQSTGIGGIEKSPIGPALYKENFESQRPRLKDIWKVRKILTPVDAANFDRSLRNIDKDLGNSIDSVNKTQDLDDLTIERQLKWNELYTQVDIKDCHTAAELTSRITKVTKAWIEMKIPELLAINSLKNFDATSLSDALTYGWIAEIEDSSGQQVDVATKHKGVLLNFMRHLVHKMEGHIYKEILTQAATTNSDLLTTLGLDQDTALLSVNLLEASLHADLLFERFMAYSQYRDRGDEEPPADLKPEELFVPLTTDENKKLYTFRELFPRNTGFLEKKLRNISTTGDWIERPGGESFRKYLMVLADYYAAKDPQKAQNLREESYLLYRQYIREGFPLVYTGPTDESILAPHMDPEQKLSIRSPDARVDEEKWQKIQKAYADSLQHIGVTNYQQESHNIMDQLIVSSIVLQGFGANSHLNAVAQEDPTIQIYLNIQDMAYDQEFGEKVLKKHLADFDRLFLETQNDLIRYMSRTCTVLHELGHWVYPRKSEEDTRIGSGNENRTLQEIKAELLYHIAVKTIHENGGFGNIGSLEQWTSAGLGSTIQMLEDYEESNDYYKASVYTLNEAFEQGAIEKNTNGQIRITNLDLYFKILQQQAQKIIALYENPHVSKEEVMQFINSQCKVGKKLKAFMNT